MKKYRILFYIAAVWNFAGAIVALSSPEMHIKIFYGAQYATKDFIAQIFLQTFWVIVAMFGVGYYLVARNPTQNKGIIILGIMGKLYVFGLWSYLFFIEKAKIMALAGGCGDLLFAILFLWCLLKLNKADEYSLRLEPLEKMIV